MLIVDCKTEMGLQCHIKTENWACVKHCTPDGSQSVSCSGPRRTPKDGLETAQY